MNCPQCGNSYAPGNRFCGNCGYNLAQTVPESVPPDSPSPTGPSDFPDTPTAPEQPFEQPIEDSVANAPPSITCPRCLHPNRPDSSFCFSCGFQLAPEQYSQTDEGTLQAFAMGSPGSFWLRAVAFIVDTLVIVVPLVILWAMFGLPLPESSGTLSEQISEQLTNPSPGMERLQILILVANLIYDTALITIWATTVGKRAFGLYVVRTDGSRVGPGRALARHLLTAVSANLTFGFIFLVVAFRSDRRGVHDLICDTVVIRRYRRQAPPNQEG